MTMASRTGYADVLVGLQYGDEGKARIVDHLAGDYDVIARFNGGANAGHTIDAPGGALRLRQVPSGVLHPSLSLYIGSGCAIGLADLADEIAMLASRGISLRGRLIVSDRCLLVQPAHVARDRDEGGGIGTTGNGIGPCYADHATRMRGGMRVAFQLRDLVADSEAVFRQLSKPDTRAGTDAGMVTHASAIARMRAAWRTVRDFVTAEPDHLVGLVEGGARVLFEGAQSVLLDLTHGEQPWVTSSHTVPAYAYVGGDLPCKYHRKTIGVAKAIVSRVGAGPFPSELGGTRSAQYCATAAADRGARHREAAHHEPARLLASDDAFDIGSALRVLTDEYGTVTGRPRRIGLLDVAQLRMTMRQHGIDEWFLNKCDCLAWFADTPRQAIPLFDGAPHGTAEPVVREFAAFRFDALPKGREDPLPPQLDALLHWLQEAVACRLRGVGLGPARDQLRFLY